MINELYQETYNAIEVGKQIQDKTLNSLSLEEELVLVNEELSITIDSKEHDILKVKKNKLEKDVRFVDAYYKLDAPTHKKVKNNYEKEKEIAVKEMNKRKKKLEGILSKAIDEITPLVNEMNEISLRGANAYKVNEVLDGNVPLRKRFTGDGALYTHQVLGEFPSDNSYSKRIRLRGLSEVRFYMDALLNPGEFIYRGNTIGKRFF